MVLWSFMILEFEDYRIFLHGALEEDIYMQQPQNFIVLEKED